MRQITVLDTNAIIDDPHVYQYYSTATNISAIPYAVIEELDALKRSSHHPTGFKAREFIRVLSALNIQSDTYPCLTGFKPATLTSGSQKYIFWLGQPPQSSDCTKTTIPAKADNAIIQTTHNLTQHLAADKVVLATSDAVMQVKARMQGLIAEAPPVRKAFNLDSLGVAHLDVEAISQQTYAAIQTHDNGLSWADLSIDRDPGDYFLCLHDGGKDLYFRHTEDGFRRVYRRNKPFFGIKPKNDLQYMALHLLKESDLDLNILTGHAGTGKTLLALAYALEHRKEFKKIYITKPLVALNDKDMGFLPGDVNSKLEPYMGSLMDNLDFIKSCNDEHGRKIISEAFKHNKIEMLPLPYIRGRSFSKSCIIIDEAQNLSPLEVKTIVTRAGEGTKLIFTGDMYQIDMRHLHKENNGVCYLVQQMADYEGLGCINLTEGTRSRLAEHGSRVL